MPVPVFSLAHLHPLVLYRSFTVLMSLVLAGMILFAVGYHLDQVHMLVLGNRLQFYGTATVIIGSMMLRTIAQNLSYNH